MPIFYLQYEAAPRPDSEDYETVGGAYVNCWVKASSEDEAQKTASAAIGEAGWVVMAIEEECREVTELLYTDNDEGREHFHQALTDGECYVFHQWPVEPQAEDNVH